MANSYGGVILVGVATDPQLPDRLGELRGVGPEDEEKLVKKIATAPCANLMSLQQVRHSHRC